ncbi:MAG: GxxExxY protein [Verrucomicrobiae bacterium]|nr:GxxExxY protein [Verrucomicrobiae bacterium]
MNAPAIALKEEVFHIVGAAMEVLNSLGHGFAEKLYENALVVEFQLRGIPHQQQPRFELFHKGVLIGQFIPDLVAYSQIVVEIKVVDQITDHERGQLLNYLKITRCKVGVLLNFKRAKLEWERLVL